jgi:uncharacterized protein
MLRPVRADGVTERTMDFRTCFGICSVALFVGVASGFFGIGGGFLIVPGLVYATGIPIIQAVGSSLLAVGCFGLTTAVNYASSGLVDWGVALYFITGGILGGVLGMLLANRLAREKNVLRYVFSAVIFIVASYILYRSGRAL